MEITTEGVEIVAITTEAVKIVAITVETVAVDKPLVEVPVEECLLCLLVEQLLAEDNYG